MRIVSFGGFIDYQIQLANVLCKKETLMLVIPANKLPSEHLLSGIRKICFKANYDMRYENNENINNLE